jgi:hypothetical protein
MSYGAGPIDDDDVSSVLTEDERFRLREVITHDVQIKKFLQASKKMSSSFDCEESLYFNCMKRQDRGFETCLLKHYTVIGFGTRLAL